jgi:hypothetical protein
MNTQYYFHTKYKLQPSQTSSCIMIWTWRLYWVSNAAVATRIPFSSILFYASSLLLHHFYFSIHISITLKTTTTTTTDERRRTNGKTPLLSIPVHLLLTMTNNCLLHYSSTFRHWIRYNNDDDDKDDDDANDTLTTALYRPFRLF